MAENKQIALATFVVISLWLIEVSRAIRLSFVALGQGLP